MKPKEISKMIEKEINGDWSITNRHNCDLKKCLIRPKRRKIRFGVELQEIWIVLEENLEMIDGFKCFLMIKSENLVWLSTRSQAITLVILTILFWRHLNQCSSGFVFFV